MYQPTNALSKQKEREPAAQVPFPLSVYTLLKPHPKPQKERVELQVLVAPKVGQVFITDKRIGVAVFQAGEQIAGNVILQT